MTGHFVHPFDDDDFISGNGTAGLEIVEDLPDVDAVVAPLGGGGLLAGIGVARARAATRGAASTPPSRRPRRRSRARSRAGEASRFDEWQASFVDGAGGKSVLADDVAAAAATYVDDSIVVSLDEAARGDAAGRRARARDRRRRRRAARSPRRSRRHGARGHRKVVAVVSGGNIDLVDASRDSSARAPSDRLHALIPDH